MTIKRTLSLCAVTAVAAAGAAGTWIAGAGTAMAPEPAKLVGSQPVVYSGDTGPATYLSGTATTIVRWANGGSANSDGSPAAGRPCTTTYLAPGSTTSKVIYAYGTSRYCY